MAFPLLDLKELARRMAMMNLKPADLQAQMSAPPPKLGDMATPMNASVVGSGRISAPAAPRIIGGATGKPVVPMGASGAPKPPAPRPMPAPLPVPIAPPMPAPPPPIMPILPPPPMGGALPIPQGVIPGAPTLPPIKPAMSLGEMMGPKPLPNGSDTAPTPPPPASTPVEATEPQTLTPEQQMAVKPELTELPGVRPASGVQPPAERATKTTPRPASGGAAEQITRGISGEIRSLVSDAAAKYGQDANTLLTIAAIESGGNPNADNPTSSAGGLFQFIDSTAKQYGLKNRNDPMEASDAGARLLRDNRNYLVQKLGREPSPGELYLAHQQGAGGAEKLLTNPDMRAADLVGADAVRLNGGSEDMTAQQFADIWINKAMNFGGSGTTGTQADVTAGMTPMSGGANSATSMLGGNDATKKETFADKLAKLGQAIDPGTFTPPTPPSGHAPLPSQGTFNRDPNSLKMIMAMLGMGGAGGGTPTLGQLLGGGR